MTKTVIWGFISKAIADKNIQEKFLFESGQTLELQHVGKIDCSESNTSFVFDISNYRNILKQKIKKVRIYGTEHYEDYNVSIPLYFKHCLSILEK